MSVTKEQAKAYTEVIEVLKYMPKEDVNKIPEDVIGFYRDNMDVSYNFKIDTNKSFDEQILLEKTKVILAIFFRDYWSTEEQREKIKQKEKYDIQLMEQQKSEKYNPDNLFPKKTEKEQPSLEVEEKSLIEYKKETWYTKFIQFMKKIFGKSK